MSRCTRMFPAAFLLVVLVVIAGCDALDIVGASFDLAGTIINIVD